jgi:cell division protein FtsW
MSVAQWSLPVSMPQPGRLHCDLVLLSACIGLLVIGYVMVSSATLHLGLKSAGSTLHYPIRQMMHIVLGLFLAAIVLMIKTEFWEKMGPWLFIVGLALLVIVLIPGMGVKVKGSVRWLSLYGMRIQVSEIVKFCTVVYMAGYVTRHADVVRASAYGLLKPLMLFSFACLLLLLEPDFGSSVVILTIAMGVMFLSGAKIWQFILLLGIIVLLAILLIYVSPYRTARIIAFLNPWEDPLNSGFQLTQALISFGRGEWFGVGLGSGIQKLFYLPEAHTDFLFSVLSEEFGLLGVVIVIALFAILVWRAFAIAVQAEKANKNFAAFLAYGLGIWFGFQSFVNMGVNMGLLPTKGLTLPLMSYGGGSMLVMCAAVALLFRVHYEVEELQVKTRKQKPQGGSRYG